VRWHLRWEPASACFIGCPPERSKEPTPRSPHPRRKYGLGGGQRGGRPLIVVFDPDDKIRHWRERQILVEKVLWEDLDRLELVYADYCTVLDTIDPHCAADELFIGHPSELGNILEAEMVIRRLLQLGWMDSSRVIDDPLVGDGPPQGVATPTVRAVESTRIA
jgi:hypothetical protein